MKASKFTSLEDAMERFKAECKGCGIHLTVHAWRRASKRRFECIYGHCRNPICKQVGNEQAFEQVVEKKGKKQ